MQLFLNKSWKWLQGKTTCWVSQLFVPISLPLPVIISVPFITQKLWMLITRLLRQKCYLNGLLSNYFIKRYLLSYNVILYAYVYMYIYRNFSLVHCPHRIWLTGELNITKYWLPCGAGVQQRDRKEKEKWINKSAVMVCLIRDHLGKSSHSESLLWTAL